MPALLYPTTAPRSTFNLEEFRDRVRGDLALRGAARVTDTDLAAWGNEAARKIARLTNWLLAQMTTDLVANTSRYAFPETTDGRCIAIQSLWHNDLPLRQIKLSDLDAYGYNWRSQTGSPPWVWWTNNGTDFQIHPTPTANESAVLDVYFYAVPPDISAPQDHFLVPIGLEDGLVIYGKKLASEKDAFGEGSRRAPGYAAEWAQFLKEAKRLVNTTNPNAVTAVGEDALQAGPPLGGYLPWNANIGL